MARFDAGTDHTLHLLRSGITLAPSTLRNPLIVVANYAFDSLPMDAFRVSENQLFESLITVTSPQPEPDPTDPRMLPRLQLSFTHRPLVEDTYYDDPLWNEILDPTDPRMLPRLQLSFTHRLVGGDAYYDDPLWNEILRGYREQLGDTSLLFPTAALQTLATLHDLSGGRLLLLSADKGFADPEALVMGAGEPNLAIHGGGCFSMMVNYHAIGEHVRRHGGQMLQPTHRQENLLIAAVLLGLPACGGVETRQAYADAVDTFTPDEYHTLLMAIEKHADSLSLSEVLAYLRWSGWDDHPLRKCLPTLLKGASTLNLVQKQEVFAAIRQVWETYYPMGEEQDLAFALATLLNEMGYLPEAIAFLEQSIALHGMAPGTAYNMAVAYHNQRQFDQALSWVERALEVAPDSDEARTLRIRLLADLQRRPT
jgi:hypothetical protein